MRIRELFEARRNPHLNPRIDPLDTFSMYARNPNMFVTYTKLPKVGINPQSKYDTPIGIYSYPLGYILERAYRTGSVFGAAPFAAGNRFVHLFEQRSRNIFDVSQYGKSQYEMDKNKLFNYFTPNITSPQELAMAIHNHEKMWSGKGASYGKIMWYLIYNLIEKFTRTRTTVEATRILFRVLGYDAAYDMDGKGVIHSNEPTQAVHFNFQTIKVLESFENRMISQERQQARSEIINIRAMIDKVELIETKYGRHITNFKNIGKSTLSGQNKDVGKFISEFKVHINYLNELYRTIKSMENELMNIPNHDVRSVVGMHDWHIGTLSSIRSSFVYDRDIEGSLYDFSDGMDKITSPTDGVIELQDGIRLMGRSIDFLSKNDILQRAEVAIIRYIESKQ